MKINEKLNNIKLQKFAIFMQDSGENLPLLPNLPISIRTYNEILNNIFFFFLLFTFGICLNFYRLY
jgi:hypothetical protein